MFAFLTSLFGKPTPPKPPFRSDLAIDYFRLPEAPAPVRPVEPIRPADYFDGATQRYRRVHPTELLNVHTDLVEQIYQATGMHRLEFRRRVYPLLEFAAAAYQLVPASASHHHREPGGLLLHSLQACRHAVHLGQFARFESDRSRSVSPDDHKVWSIGLSLAALTHDAGKLLTDFRVVHPSFFSPGRLLPRLDNGAPPEDERTLFVPYDDTLYTWLGRYDYHEYMVHWLQNRYGKHDGQSRALINTWTNLMKSVVLPEKVRRTLATTDPRPGSVETDFWDIINKADRRSCSDYFPTPSGKPGVIIAETLRSLVRDGTWRPSPNSYPLCITDNQRLLLRDPIDLGNLATHIYKHPQSYALVAEGLVPTDVLASHFQFEGLVEANPAMQARFAASAVAPGSTVPDQHVLILNESLSRELLDLASALPPVPIPPTQVAAPMAVDLRHLADPLPANPGELAAPQATSSSAPSPTSSAAPTKPHANELPPLVIEFLDHVRSLNPEALFAADRAGQPRPPRGPRLEDISLAPGDPSRIVVGRKVVQRFKHLRGEPLDTVFSTLIGCTRIVTHVDPPPPRPTVRLTLSASASAAILGRATGPLARSSAAPSPVGDRPPASPAPQTARTVAVAPASPRSSTLQVAPEFRAIPWLYRLFAHPSVQDYLKHHLANLPLNVRFQTLAAVLARAQREETAIETGLDPEGLAQLFVDGGLPIQIVPGGICLKPAIAEYWLRYKNEVVA